MTVEYNDKEVRAALSSLLTIGADMTPIMRDIAGVLADATERAFANESDPTTGEPWDVLSYITTKRRESAGHWPGSILQVTGQLARDIETDYGPDFAQIATNTEYARTMHDGADKGEYGSTEHGVPIPWGDIPGRPFFGVGEEDRAEIPEVVKSRLMESWNQH